MTIGVPREIKTQEHRVGMIPPSVAELTKQGHTVVVESGAGSDSSYADEHYASAGAFMVDTAADA